MYILVLGCIQDPLLRCTTYVILQIKLASGLCDGSKSGLIVQKQLPRCLWLRTAQVDTRTHRSGMRGAGENPTGGGQRRANQRLLIPTVIAAPHDWLLMWGDWRGFRMFHKKDDNSINSNQFSLYKHPACVLINKNQKNEARRCSGDKRHMKKKKKNTPEMTKGQFNILSLLQAQRAKVK